MLPGGNSRIAPAILNNAAEGNRHMGYVKLKPLEKADRNQFIIDNQAAFRFGALEEFGLRDTHFEESEEIISKQTIEQSIVYGDPSLMTLEQWERFCGGMLELERRMGWGT